MKKKKKLKIAIVGPGRIGTIAAYQLLEKQIASKIYLIGSNIVKTSAEVKDIQHTLSGEIEVGNLKDCNKADLVIITAAIRHLKPKEERKSLLEYNIALIKNIIKPIKTNPIILIVTTPIEALAYATLKLSHASNSKIITTGTVLDTQRLKFLLSQKNLVSNKEIDGVLIGEHGSGVIPVWDTIKIKGKRIKKDPRLLQDIKNIGLEIGIGKGGSSWFGIVSSISKIAEAVQKESNEYITVGSYNEKYGVVLSLPTRLGRKGVIDVREPKLDQEAQIELNRVVKNLVKQQSKVDNIL